MRVVQSASLYCSRCSCAYCCYSSAKIFPPNLIILITNVRLHIHSSTYDICSYSTAPVDNSASGRKIRPSRSHLSTTQYVVVLVYVVFRYHVVSDARLLLLPHQAQTHFLPASATPHPGGRWPRLVLNGAGHVECPHFHSPESRREKIFFVPSPKETPASLTLLLSRHK